MKKETVLTWEQWADDLVEAEKQGDRLRAEGWFTAEDFANKTDKPLNTCRQFLHRQSQGKHLKSQQALAKRSDGKVYPISFYHLP